MENELYLQTKAAVEELGRKANLKPGNILVVGCSTSEVLGAKIGSQSSPEVAKQLQGTRSEEGGVGGSPMAGMILSLISI